MKESNKYFLALLFMCLSFVAMTQTVTIEPHCENEDFDKTVIDYVDPEDVALIDVDDLKKDYDKYIVLDAREPSEYKVSHLPGAIYIGYNDFKPSRMEGIDKDLPIIVYCSVGYRSGRLGYQLKGLGYTNVLNLYGSIFEWVNRGYEVHDMKGQNTNKVHTYNRKWSRWVDNPEMKKEW